MLPAASAATAGECARQRLARAPERVRYEHLREKLWTNRVASEIVFQFLHLDTGAPLHEERVTAVREKPNLHLEFYLQGVTDGMRSPWKLLVGGFEDSSGGDYSCDENRKHVAACCWVGFPFKCQ